MAELSYAAPSSVEAAVTLLAEAGGAARVMAGGTDVLVLLHGEVIGPALIVDVKNIETVLDDNVSVTIGIGTFDGCVQTADFLPPEPDELEHKFFAPGLGLIYETKPGEPETVELVSYSGL